ncbi:MAG: hypothetical protein ACRENX_05095 [Candidatus Dormibacteria bacterium]
MTTEDIRRWAIAHPEVAESSHFLFHSPVFKVRGRSFLGLGRGEKMAVFLISQEDTDEEAAGDPSHCRSVRRQDATRSLLGLEVEFAHVSSKRIERLVEQAWRQQAPKRLVAARDRGESAGSLR